MIALFVIDEMSSERFFHTAKSFDASAEIGGEFAPLKVKE
jgi:hypothetical protein